MEYGQYHGERIELGLNHLRVGQHLTGKSCFINLGAHVGTVFIPTMKSALFKQGIAVEPDPKNFDLLSRNCHEHLQESSFKLFKVAVGETEGSGSMMSG